MTRIIEILPLPKGGHRNQTGMFDVIPEGYAVIPPGMNTPNFPFGEMTVEEVNGVMTVTKWIPIDIPVTPESEKPVSEIEQLRADVDYLAAMTGVEW